MKLRCGQSGYDYDFKPITLAFDSEPYSDVFGQKNNKTVLETIQHQRYAKFKKIIVEQYPSSLNEPLGTFLLYLKKNGDEFYKCFLNKYGDLRYSIFAITDSAYFDSKGIYAYLAGNELKYIGRCKDSMKKRVNQGYGKIHPKNCYLDGQATNCHLNSKITKRTENISLWLYQMDIPSKIEFVEKTLIQAYKPSWNIQHN